MSQIENVMESRPVPRRVIAAGVAWSAPAIWLASAAPAMAASATYAVTWSAKYSCNNSKWELTFKINNERLTTPKVTEIKVTAPFGWRYIQTLNTTLAANGETTIGLGYNAWEKPNGGGGWVSVTDTESYARWGATPLPAVPVSPPNSDVLYSDYCREAVCTSSDQNCVCQNCSGTCLGPCAILAMQGAYTVAVTLQLGANTWTVTSSSVPNSCGVHNNDSCKGKLASNVSPT